MNIPHVLSDIISGSGSLGRILDAAVNLVATEMDVDVCSIYLLDLSTGALRLASSKGFKPESIGRAHLGPDEGITGAMLSSSEVIAVQDARDHPAYHYLPETGEEAFRSYLGAPMRIGRRPVGAIVLRTRAVRAYSETEMRTLQIVAAQLVGVVDNARLVEAIDAPDGGRRYLDELRHWNLGLRQYRPSTAVRGEVVLHGLAASPGIAMGAAMIRGAPEALAQIDAPSEGADAERARLSTAIEKTRQDLGDIRSATERETDEEHALIFSAHLMLLNDPGLKERLDEAVGLGVNAVRAVDREFSGLASQLRAVHDEYLRERAEDIEDLKARLLSHLVSGASSGDAGDSMGRRIVVAEGISPSTVVELRASGALGIVTERGTRTSHGALLARAMAIPAVTGVPDLVSRLRTGENVVVDGVTGTVVLRPGPETIERYRLKAERFAAHRKRLQDTVDEPARSLDGVRIRLLANVGIASEIDDAVEQSAEGIGLFRSEFLFLGREDYPTPDDQEQSYRYACDRFPDGPTYFRLLDVGGDKPYPRLTCADEPNPALGYRSIRILLDSVEILREQVRALLCAASGRQIGIVLPLVTSLAEIRATREVIQEVLDELGRDRELPAPRIGVMVEVPAAVEIAPGLATEADFLSIGTNDLIQFALAADRDNPRVATVADPFHPGVLCLVRRTIEAAHSVGKEAGCCGEMAAVPEIAVLLTAMGADYLSLSPAAILEVKDAIRGAGIGSLRERLDEILALSEARLVRRAVNRSLGRIDACEAPSSPRPRRA